MKFRLACLWWSVLLLLVAGSVVAPSGALAATPQSQPTLSLTLTNTPGTMVSAQTAVARATLGSPRNDGVISFSERFSPQIAGLPAAGSIFACKPVNGSCSMTWSTPAGFAGAVAIIAVWSGDAQFGRSTVSLNLEVARSHYIYTGTWQGRQLPPLTQVVPAPFALFNAHIAGQLTSFATRDPAYACLAGHALTVYLAPVQYHDDYVALTPAQGSCPAAAFLFPQPPAVSSAPATANVGQMITIRGSFPQDRPADAGVQFLGVLRATAPILSWGPNAIVVRVPATLFTGQYSLLLSWHDAGTASEVSNAATPVAVQVTGRTLTPKPTTAVRVLDTPTLHNLKTLPAGKASGRLIFTTVTPFLRNLKSGAILMAPTAPQARYGLLNKVKSVTIANGTATVMIGPATLHDALIQGSYDVHEQLSNRIVQSFTPAMPGVTVRPDVSGKECIDINNKGLYSDHSGNSIVVNGNACITASIDASGYIDTSGAGASVTASVGDSIGLHLTGHGAASFDKEISLGTFVLTPIVFSIGPVPVVIVPEIDFSVGAHGSIQADVSLGATQQASVTASVGCSVDWFPPDVGCGANGDTDSSFIPDPVVLKGNATLKADASIAVKALLYGVAGGDLELQGYVEGDINTASDPWWSILAGLKLDAGFDLEVFTSYKKNWTLAEWKTVIAQADGPLGAATLQIAASPLQVPCTRGTYHGEPIANCAQVHLKATFAGELGPVVQSTVTFEAPHYEYGPSIGSCTTDNTGTCSINWDPKDKGLGAGDVVGTYLINVQDHSGTIKSSAVKVIFKIVIH